MAAVSLDSESAEGEREARPARAKCLGRPRHFLFRPMAKKASKATASEISTGALQSSAIEGEWSEGTNENGHVIPGREDLLAEAIRAVRAALKKETTPTRTSIGNLVQLLRLHREIFREEETPTHIQLVWNEVDEELYGDD